MDIDIANLNSFDMGILSIIFISTLLALFKGFCRTILSFLSWIVAIVALILGYTPVSEFFAQNINNTRMVQVLSVLSIFIGSFIVMYIVNSNLLNLLRGIGIGGVFDRTLGFAFGLLRGVVIACLLFLAINLAYVELGFGNSEAANASEENTPEFVAQAKTYNMLKLASYYMLSYIPETFYDDIEGGITKLGNGLPKVSPVITGASVMPGVLDARQRSLMQSIIAALPDNKVADLYENEYTASNQDISELEKRAIFRELLEVYQQQVAAGDITAIADINDEELKKLQDDLSGDNLSDAETKDSGYRTQQIQQMERLINSLK